MLALSVIENIIYIRKHDQKNVNEPSLSSTKCTDDEYMDTQPFFAWKELFNSSI